MRKTIPIIMSIFIVTALVLFAGNNQPGTKVRPTVKDTNIKAPLFKPEPNFGKIPLYFIPNKGQVNEKACYYAKTSGYTLWMTKEGLVFDSIRKAEVEAKAEVKAKPILPLPHSTHSSAISRDVSMLAFLNADKNPEIVPLDKTEHKVNYFIGNNKSDWRTGIPTSKAVLYKSVYKDIDLKVYGIESQIEYDWIVKPGGKVEDISFEYKNVKKTRIDKEGNLIISTKFGDLTHKKPVSFQMIDGKKINVPSAFKELDNNRFAFKVGVYNPNLKLYIDPLVLVYSTYFGGDANFGVANWLEDILVDDNDYFYVLGKTNAQDFPVDYNFGYNPDNYYLYVVKFTPDGQAVAFSSLIGGSSIDFLYEASLDSNNCVYLTGSTNSTNFPITSGTFQTSIAGEEDAFVTKLSSSGDALIYSTYLGGSNDDFGLGIDVDDNSSAYIIGHTKSTNFPTENAFDSSFNGGDRDTFVTKMSSDGRSLIFSTYIGGDSFDAGYGIAVDNSHSVYMTGYTSSNNFPVYNAFQNIYAGGYYDAFVAKLNSDGNTLAFSTFLGGNDQEISYDISVDSYGFSYITGYTYSSDFPIVNNFFGWQGGSDCFITKFSNTGSSLIYSTLIGGIDEDSGTDIAIDNIENVYITGYTNSENFLIKEPWQNNLSGNYDCFIAKVSFNGTFSVLDYSTYLGGSNNDINGSIAVNNNGTIYAAGYTNSTDFPLQNPYKDTYTGTFISKFNFSGGSPEITVTSPNGGEILQLGKNKTITWDTQDISETLKITLWKDGAWLGRIANNIDPSTGSYTWIVGESSTGTAPAETGYTIRIKGEGISIKDDSDASFTLCALTVTSPNGGENLTIGSTQSITWDAPGVPGLVKITLYKDGVFVGRIASNIDASSGTYAWTAGEHSNGTATAGTGYTIRVRCTEPGALIHDDSNTGFTLN